MGIKTDCSKCGVEIVFPDTPSADTDKYEHLAFSIYSFIANDSDRVCCNCKK